MMKKFKGFLAVILSVTLVFCALPIVSIETDAASYSNGYTGSMPGDGKIYAEGLDVSAWQGSSLNFANIKNAGYSYVILRCGTTKGKDSCFETYYKNAKAVGLNVGAYYYSYATSTSAAATDASNCLSWISGKQFEYPIYFDYEDSSQSSISGTNAAAICYAFLDRLKAAGYLPGLYSMASWLDQSWVTSSGLRSNYEGWVARYLNSGQHSPWDPTYSVQYGMYQYTSSKYVNGAGPFDANVCYKNYPSIVKNYGFNGYNSTDQQVKKFIFDAGYYAGRYEDLRNAYGTDETKLYNHFLNYGIAEGRCASPYFDVKYYMNNNDQELRDYCGGDCKKAYNHFLQYVKNEGELANTPKKLSEIFDTGYYYNKYKDLRDAGLNTEYKLLEHFYNNGTKEWRSGSAEFDPVCYALNNKDVYDEYIVKQNKNVPGIYYHYMRFGQFETAEKPYRLKKAEAANLGTSFYATITDKNSGKNLELVYNVSSSEYPDKNSVQINTARESRSQIWKFERQSDGTYKIINKKYSKVLDIYNGLRTKTNVGAYRDNDTTGDDAGSQRWTLYMKDGYVVMKGGCTGFVADVGGKATADYSEVLCDSFNGGDNQLFSINIIAEDLGENFSASINTVCDESMALSLNESESVVVKTDTDSEDQIWNFEQQSDGSYKIINSSNGKCLALSGGNTADKTDIIAEEDKDSDAQKWYIIRDTDGSCVIRPVCGMKANVTMDLYGTRKGDEIPDGRNISIYTFNGSDAQQYIIEFKGEDLGTDFEAVISTECDRSKVLTADTDQNLMIKTNAGTDDQLWHFERQSDSTYTLTNKANGKCIDLESWKTADKSNIATHSLHGGTNQRWAFIKNANGSYTIRPVCGFGANAVMELYGANTADGSNISIYGYNASKAQQFYVEKPNVSVSVKDGLATISWENFYIGEGENFTVKIYKDEYGSTAEAYKEITVDSSVTSTEVELETGNYELKVIAGDSTYSSEAVAFTVKSTYLLGDVDLDGAVSIKDATKLQYIIAEDVEFDENMLYVCDVTKDGAVNVNDATLIQMYCANRITQF